jgi:hypothetical protein
MASGARLSGKVEMQGRFRNVTTNYGDRVGRAAYAEMGIEEAEVIKRTPKLSGDLRGTIHRIGPRQEGKTISVLIVAGGPDAPYAWIVHEDLEAIHKIGQAKYLESVIMESRSFIGARVARRLNIADWV